MVMMNQLIKKFMNKPEATRRMVQWAIELSQFDIEYYPRTAIKAQALADFIAEFTLRTRTAQLTKQNGGRYRPMIRQPKKWKE